MFETLLQSSAFQFSILLFALILFLPLGISILILISRHRRYQKSAYYQITKVPYFSLSHDLGKLGEYLTYTHLKRFEKDGAKFLFNVYIPKWNGETTEIDVLMISKKGIFVLESKNYSGWIFGSENQKNWCQTLPAGKGKSHKEYFYNPIMQNQSHIRHLQAWIGKPVLTHSIIVFSKRCTLKNIEVTSAGIQVIKRNEIASVISKIYKTTPDDQLSEAEISALYQKLYPYTQVNEKVKKQHIANIQNNLMNLSHLEKQKAAPVPKKEQKPSQTIKKQGLKSNAASPSPKKLQKRTKQTTSQASQADKCPQCGGTLVLRTAGKGTKAGHPFWGCSNFPKCRYTRDMDK